jgi:hypothetical protein
MCVVIEILITVVFIAGLAYLGGLEKEKRDVLKLVQIMRRDPSATLQALEQRIEFHHHRKLNRRSNYDERKR